jgi:argininosuccinate lyase
VVKNSKSNKLWGSRFTDNPAEILEKFNASISFDYKLYRHDIQASVAHAKMLSQQNIINTKEYKAIEKALKQIEEEISVNPKAWAQERIKEEDIHLAIELRLTSLIGDIGKKLHTARSRNDQVITDLRLWLRDELTNLELLLKNLRKQLIKRAEQDLDYIMPGYTHMQQAQPISVGHFWLAHEARFSRDSERLNDSLKRININPLGSGALAGSTFPIDREMTTKELGFTRPSENSLDAVSDRDFVLEYEFNLSMIMLHLSQLAEEMIIWNSQEFGYIEISDSFATGSSMMPQKKNPDIPELLRGKTGRVIGVLNALMMTVKGLPLAYNKDLQEDKEMLFMANDTTQDCLAITVEFLDNIKLNQERMYQACAQSYCGATDAAEYLVKEGMPFRDAYKCIGEIVKYSINSEKYLTDLDLKEWQKFSKLFKADITKKLSPEACVDARDIIGGTSRRQVKRAIKFAQRRLGDF